MDGTGTPLNRYMSAGMTALARRRESGEQRKQGRLPTGARSSILGESEALNIAHLQVNREKAPLAIQRKGGKVSVILWLWR